ncbi:MAG: hypothetical protein QF864_06630, partial [SAR202 cluster bacterium]|nr:hypothetical protein [SAR202 cluster bacterium]
MTPAKRNIQIKKLIDGKSLKKIRGYFENKENIHLVNFYNNIRKLIDSQLSKSSEVLSEANRVKYHREIFDFEIICDCIIEAIGPMYQTESMKKWDPLPFNDEGTRYRLYRNYRFNKITGISQDVSDDIIIELLKGDVEDEQAETIVPLKAKIEEKIPEGPTKQDQPVKATKEACLDLCEKLLNSEYKMTDEEEKISKHKTFSKWRYDFMRDPKNDMYKNFPSIMSELEKQKFISYDKFAK